METKPDVSYVVYVWDTREIVETGHIRRADGDLIAKIKAAVRLAEDNHKPLKGKDADKFNRKRERKQSGQSAVISDNQITVFVRVDKH